ncbi:hypothetical protein CPB86DRAFT_474768 [Serendipita vermifera]|nr:hypothetical protein CPB86DRAFT_474768 [Serendipita vermifera]
MERNTYTKAITLYRKHKLELVGFNPDGIGETCGQLISRGAGIIEDKVGKVAHRMRMGPEAAMNRILTTLKTKERVALLEEWYQLPKGGEISPMLERDLQILLKYALPENIETQITAFVAIASLITQYPPLKSIFLRYEKFTDLANPKEAALNLWKREYLPSNPRWEGFYQIAAACLSDDVSRILGATSIEMWGTVSPSALSVVDQLLAKISSERLETLDYVVIRYLGGILQLPTFWESRNYEQHKYTVTTLLRKLLHCIKETGIEHRGEELFCDREGIDILVDATLHGIQRWKFISAEITIQLWFSYFNDILGLLHR